MRDAEYLLRNRPFLGWVSVRICPQVSNHCQRNLIAPVRGILGNTWQWANRDWVTQVMNARNLDMIFDWFDSRDKTDRIYWTDWINSCAAWFHFSFQSCKSTFREISVKSSAPGKTTYKESARGAGPSLTPRPCKLHVNSFGKSFIETSPVNWQIYLFQFSNDATSVETLKHNTRLPLWISCLLKHRTHTRQKSSWGELFQE